MKKRLNRFGIHKTSLTMAALYFAVSLIFVPFFFIASMFGQGPAAKLGAVFALAIPFGYAIIGYVFVALAGLAYNFIAKYTGGIEISTVDVPEV